MACSICDAAGWVCENHPDRPWSGTSQRADACECGAGSDPAEASLALRMALSLAGFEWQAK
jgi:hypothetical protein